MTAHTIGYENRGLEDFVSLLRKHGIDMVVDVRRFPTSKRAEFKRERLEVVLPRSGIRYVPMREPGGFRKGGYQKYMETETYKEGIKNLLELTKQCNVAIMCVERSPRACHRRFISQTLEDMNVRVVHIK